MEGGRRWEDLAMDCLVNVFSRLNLEDLTLGVPFVCKSWHKASLDPQCWKILNFRALDLMPWGNFSKRFAQEYRIKSFSFSSFMKLATARSRRSAIDLSLPSTAFIASLPDLIYASNECPRVKLLALPDILQPYEKHIPEILGRWKELEFLDMGLKPLSFVPILEQISLKCKSFVGLQMYGCLYREDALAIVTHLPKLKYLAMKGSYLSKQELLVILDGCRELEELDVTRCRGFDVDDEILRKASGIKAFEYKGSKFHDDYDEYDQDVLWGLVLGVHRFHQS
ncbi:F-box/LRR-repeat protein [Cocos nucifera]|uniref:F-box/LRR-repeat protein n=1 Tax=Cocos nucifera TaxID=13894 RepID=A0A8K0N3U0_COCNU|nr:F-box/LRR-repeat protein [Cocos nucifera]